MDLEHFTDGVFRLADIWCESSGQEEFLNFLDTLAYLNNFPPRAPYDPTAEPPPSSPSYKGLGASSPKSTAAVSHWRTAYAKLRSRMASCSPSMQSRPKSMSRAALAPRSRSSSPVTPSSRPLYSPEQICVSPKAGSPARTPSAAGPATPTAARGAFYDGAAHTRAEGACGIMLNGRAQDWLPPSQVPLALLNSGWNAQLQSADWALPPTPTPPLPRTPTPASAPAPHAGPPPDPHPHAHPTPRRPPLPPCGGLPVTVGTRVPLVHAPLRLSWGRGPGQGTGRGKKGPWDPNLVPWPEGVAPYVPPAATGTVALPPAALPHMEMGAAAPAAAAAAPQEPPRCEARQPQPTRHPRLSPSPDPVPDMSPPKYTDHILGQLPDHAPDHQRPPSDRSPSPGPAAPAPDPPSPPESPDAAPDAAPPPPPPPPPPPQAPPTPKAPPTGRPSSAPAPAHGPSAMDAPARPRPRGWSPSAPPPNSARARVAPHWAPQGPSSAAPAPDPSPEPEPRPDPTLAITRTQYMAPFSPMRQQRSHMLPPRPPSAPAPLDAFQVVPGHTGSVATIYRCRPVASPVPPSLARAHVPLGDEPPGDHCAVPLVSQLSAATPALHRPPATAGWAPRPSGPGPHPRAAPQAGPQRGGPRWDGAAGPASDGGRADTREVDASTSPGPGPPPSRPKSAAERAEDAAGSVWHAAEDCIARLQTLEAAMFLQRRAGYAAQPLSDREVYAAECDRLLTAKKPGVMKLLSANAVRHDGLEALALGGRGITNARPFLDLIRLSTRLRHVFFTDNALTNEGAILIAGALATHPTAEVWLHCDVLSLLVLCCRRRVC